jgi:hypothetical protein
MHTRSPGIPSDPQVQSKGFSFCNWYHFLIIAIWTLVQDAKSTHDWFGMYTEVGAASGINGSQFWPPPSPNKPSRAGAWLQHCSISCLFLVLARFVQAVLEQQEGTLDRYTRPPSRQWSAACLGWWAREDWWNASNGEHLYWMSRLHLTVHEILHGCQLLLHWLHCKLSCWRQCHYSCLDMDVWYWLD